jgi:hypothetical protein
MAIALGGAIWLARRDREMPRTAASVAPRTIRLPEPPTLPSFPQPPADLREAAADLDRAAEEARKAADELRRVKAEIEQQREDLKVVKADADANAERTKRDMEEARSQLESQRAALERASREAEARVKSAGAELERIQQQQLAQAAAAGGGRGLSPSRQSQMAARADLPRGRRSSMPPFMPVDAAAGGMLPQIPASPGVTMDQAIRVAASGAPPRLSKDDLDAKTGEITWPPVLANDCYSDLTSAIEVPFRDRAARGGRFDAAERATVEQLIDRLVERLQADVTRHSSGRYGAARSFLDSLRAECGLASDR